MYLFCLGSGVSKSHMHINFLYKIKKTTQHGLLRGFVCRRINDALIGYCDGYLSMATDQLSHPVTHDMSVVREHCDLSDRFTSLVMSVVREDCDLSDRFTSLVVTVVIGDCDLSDRTTSLVMTVAIGDCNFV